MPNDAGTNSSPQAHQSNTSSVGALSIGLAMFSMFFGAGNIAFPIILGQYAGSQNIFAISGLIVTAVLVPFLGLSTVLMYNGDYKAFFGRIGVIPGMLAAIVIMALIGPFGALPRCITLSYSTFSLYSPEVTLTSFSIFSCLLVFVLSIKKNSVVNILGNYLTPILLFALATIIVLGFIDHPPAPVTSHGSVDIFTHGFFQGYNTMDLFAALFFSIVIIPAFKTAIAPDLENHPKQVARLALKSSLIGMFLLAIIYAGMSFVASFYTDALQSVREDQQLGMIANHILGPYAGIVANAAVSLACLTTAITLAVVFTDFVRTEIFRSKIPYELLLVVTLFITYWFSKFGFSGIVSMISPVLVIMCPALITLSVFNLLHRFYGVKMVKAPVFGVFIVTILVTYLPKTVELL